MDDQCGYCAQDVDHCHGTLLLHQDTAADCTEPECVDLDPVRHPLVLECAEVVTGCCPQVEFRDLARAG